jgi:subtilisin family serine protease
MIDSISGVVGVNWTTSIMGSKWLDATGRGKTDDAVNAIEFAIQAKILFDGNASTGANVRVLSNSWHINVPDGMYPRTLCAEIDKANDHGILFVAAAGNKSSDIDVHPQYPASCKRGDPPAKKGDPLQTELPNLIAVAATDSTDALASSFSNFGASSVHLGAPGVNVYSTWPQLLDPSGFKFLDGTSMATPHVSGAAALIISKCSLDTPHLKATILNNVDPLPSLAGLTVTGGRLNVNKALRACLPPPSITFDAINGDDPEIPPSRRKTHLGVEGANFEPFSQVEIGVEYSGSSRAVAGGIAVVAPNGSFVWGEDIRQKGCDAALTAHVHSVATGQDLSADTTILCP